MSASLLVLLVEDNVVNQRVAESMLSRAGHRVVIAANGSAAVDRVKETDFDIVLMDLQMPVLGGLEATRYIREWELHIGGHVPIVAVTARALASDRDECLAAGMDGYLSKPIQSAALLAAISEAVEGPGSAVRVQTSPFAPEDDVLDLAALRVTVRDDPDLLLELAQLFLEDVPDQLSAMRTAIAEGNANDLRSAGHAMKGAASTISARQVARIAGRLEDIGEHHALVDAPAAFDALACAVDELSARLAALLAEV